MYMMRMTSWDANVFLCLKELLPEDVVKGMIQTVKITHEEFSKGKAMAYWVSNSPQLLRQTVNYGPKTHKYIFSISVPRQDGVSRKSWDDERNFRIDVWKKRRENIIEFKREWRYRSIEERQKKVIDWCRFGEEQEQRRHQVRLGSKSVLWHAHKFACNDYTDNLWISWGAWAYCEHPPQIANWDTSRMISDWDRRTYVSKWYEGIHPGRFFLFYKENKIIKERNRGVQKGPCEDGYVYPRTPIFDWGPYEQLIEDLKCIDGGGLGEKVGEKVEHIDDIFMV